LRAFVGHRFTPAVTRTLRHNLQIVLRPYGITPVYSDSDMPNGPVFETILDRIRRADFSIFDDRETEVRPNVLIELGAAIGMQRPYFYFNYGKKRTVRIKNRQERITTASDLAGMLYMPYTTHRELFVDFARRLPGFLLDRALAAPLY
jgi:predicted nucleotide-binding protein